MCSQPELRIRNLEANSRVALNFDGERGGDIVVLSGTAARTANCLPPPATLPISPSTTRTSRASA